MCFNARYNDYDVLEIIEQNLHSAFTATASTPKVNYSLFFEEMDTALEVGFFDYWNSSHDQRASVVAARRIRKVFDAMKQWDRQHSKGT